MPRPDNDWTPCAACDRGGRGNAKDKCASGWQVTTFNGLGCMLGEPIVGTPREPPKLTRSQRNYQEWLNVDNGCSFAEWMGMDKESVERRARRRAYG